MKSDSTLGAFAKFTLGGHACSDMMCRDVNRANQCQRTAEEAAAMLLAGGIMQHGHQCGMLWGAALAAGARTQQVSGPSRGAQAAAVRAAGRAAAAFRDQNGTVNCKDLTGVDQNTPNHVLLAHFFLKGGVVACSKRVARFGPAARAATLDDGQPEPLGQGPVSCAAELARRLDATPEQACMAAGLAGGIGLCGGACGALGAAVWMLSLRHRRSTGNPMNFRAPEGLALIACFEQCTGKRYNCSEICGRRFGNVQEHADYLEQGGCSKLLDVLCARKSYKQGVTV
jgi:hypothetical protein